LKRPTIFNIPNVLTICRLFFIPFLVIFILFDSSWSNIVSAVIFIVASITDYIDGLIARKMDQITDFGKIFDPIADKILVASALILLVEVNRIPGWVVIILLGREFAVSALRDYASSKGIIIPAGFSGKLKTATQMVAVIFIIYNNTFFYINFGLLGAILIYVSVFISIYSLIEYYLTFFKNNVL